MELYAERLSGPLCHLKPVLRIRPSGIPDVVNDPWGLVHLDSELHILAPDIRQHVCESRDDATRSREIRDQTESQRVPDADEKNRRGRRLSLDGH